jgi:hypothetical protein
MNYRRYFTRSPSVIWIYAVFFWLLLAFISISLNYYRGYVRGYDYPFNSSYPAMAFGDFFGNYAQWIDFGGFGKSGYGVLYFPAAYLFLQFIIWITGDWRELALILSLSVWIIGSIFFAFKYLREKGFILTLILTGMILFSYPSLFIFHTGNLEGWVGFFILAGGVSASKNKWNLFAIFIGIAGACKGVPLVFALVPFVVLNFKHAFVVFIKILTVLFSMTLLALVVLPGGYLSDGFNGIDLAIRGILASQEKYSELMVNSAAGIHYGHSFLNAVHALFGMQVLPSELWGPIIFWISVLILGLLLVLQKFSNTELWVKLLGISSIACIGMATSTDYKLVYLATPLLIATESKFQSWTTRVLLFSTIFAMSSKPYLYLGIDPFGNATVYLTALCLIFIIFICYIDALVSIYRLRTKKNLLTNEI